MLPPISIPSRCALILFLTLTVSAQSPQPVPSARRMPDGKQWTTQNLNLNISPSFCYDASEANCRQYGRLYTWQSALSACRALGPGWRLPTNDEWHRLALHYGGVIADSPGGAKATFKALILGGPSGFDALLAGGRTYEGDYARLEAHGFYWTASEGQPGAAWFYNFGKGILSLNRHDSGEKQRAFSVRCIRD